MGPRKRKGETGEAACYITRNRAVKKLQLKLHDFRRLCILKGIYPREPRHRRKAQRGDNTIKTLYLKKDIQFLMHEPIIWKFREHKAHMKKIAKAKNRKDGWKKSSLIEHTPMYRLDHIVRERYPSFVDAVQDLDDPLTLCYMFSKIARTDYTTEMMIETCRRLVMEFMLYVIEVQALRKVFISIKGYYYQVEVMGQTITWLTPHPFSPVLPIDTDYKIMKAFADFYMTLVGFVNFRLYSTESLVYPPRLPRTVLGAKAGEETAEDEMDRLATLNMPLMKKAADEEEVVTLDTHLLETDIASLKAAEEETKLKAKQQNLFRGLKFYASRETNIESLTFVIRSCRGQISWDSSVAPGFTYQESDETITHQIVDRPMLPKYLSRYYIQPQWVYDCINARLLLPVQDYFIGAQLPPHLSPFNIEGHIYEPPEKKELIARQKGEVPIDVPKALMDSDDENNEEKTTQKNNEQANYGKGKKKKKGKKANSAPPQASTKTKKMKKTAVDSDKQEQEDQVKAGETGKAEDDGMGGKNSKAQDNDKAVDNDKPGKDGMAENNDKAEDKEVKDGMAEENGKAENTDKAENVRKVKDNNSNPETPEEAAKKAQERAERIAKNIQVNKEQVALIRHEKVKSKMKVEKGTPLVVGKRSVKEQEKEEERLAIMTMSRKKKRIFDILKKKERRVRVKAAKLKGRRQQYEQEKQQRSKASSTQ